MEPVNPLRVAYELTGDKLTGEELVLPSAPDLRNRTRAARGASDHPLYCQNHQWYSAYSLIFNALIRAVARCTWPYF